MNGRNHTFEVDDAEPPHAAAVEPVAAISPPYSNRM